MVARRHHYVPQYYLKGFSVPRKGKHQVFVFDREERKSFPTAIANVAAEKDFNRIELEGHALDAFENAVAKFEGKAAPALERIICARSIREGDDRAFLFNLVGLLAIRNPRHRRMWHDFEERIWKTVMDLVTATRDRWAGQVKRMRAAGYLTHEPDADYDKIRKLVVEDGFHIQVPTGRHIAQELEAFDAILPYLFERKWSLLKATRDSGGFVTSDHPVCLMWADPKRRSLFHGPGFGLHDTQIVFPICTQLAMIGAFEIVEEHRDAPEDLVAAINGTIIQYAERQVYARDLNFLYRFEQGEKPRKASKLISDTRFLLGRSRTRK
jgi:hypothetical protein